jgi:hypothetical protein
VYAPSESAEVYKKGFELFGLAALLKGFMSDSSPASFKLEQELLGTYHTLCFQHFRQHLSDAIATFTLAEKTPFWTLAMKVLKWRGYASDNALMADIIDLQQLAHHNARVAELIVTLVNQREKLCMFHVSKVFTMMRIASAAAEATHSALKGAGEFKRLLRASNFYESLLHILQSMKIYVDDTVKDIREALEKGYTYSRYARDFINAAWTSMSHCEAPRHISDQVWEVLESVPASKSKTKHASPAYELPAFTQLHRVTLNVHSNPTCTCPEYTQGLRICSAVCAVLFSLGRASEHKNAAMLHPIWHITNHPLAGLVQANVPLKNFVCVQVDEDQQQQVCFYVVRICFEYT